VHVPLLVVGGHDEGFVIEPRGHAPRGDLRRLPGRDVHDVDDVSSAYAILLSSGDILGSKIPSLASTTVRKPSGVASTRLSPLKKVR